MKYRSLSQTHLKFFAVFFMTVDHIGAYAFRAPMVANYATALRALGRLSAPLFLFCLVESLYYTSSTNKLILRLYVANILCNCLTIFTNLVAQDMFGFHWVSSIFPTYLYTAISVVYIKLWIETYQQRNWKRLFCLLIVFAVFLIWYATGPTAYLAIENFSNFSTEGRMLLSGFIKSIFPSPYYVDYSWLFILMGILWYFNRTKAARTAILLFFSAISYIGYRIGHTIVYFGDFFEFNQYFMVLIIPFIWSYNGTRGHKTKLFFYWYYPLHILVLRAINMLV